MQNDANLTEADILSEVVAPGEPTMSDDFARAVLAVRFLLATAPDGTAAPVQFVEDEPGGAARRLTVVHAAAEPRGRGTVVVFLRAADGLDGAGFAAFRKKFGTVRAEAKLNGNVLTAEAAGETQVRGKESCE